jgi:hypothetical protein
MLAPFFGTFLLLPVARKNSFSRRSKAKGMRLALLLATTVILIRDPTGKWTGDPLEPWFQSLQNKVGLYCCAKADGHPLDDGEWDIKENNYRVFIQGRWVVVPDDAVLSGPNRFGKAIVWFRNYPWRVTPDTRIQCFIPGSGV